MIHLFFRKTDKRITKLINIVPNRFSSLCFSVPELSVGFLCFFRSGCQLQQEHGYGAGLWNKGQRSLFAVLQLRSWRERRCKEEVGEEDGSLWQASCLQVHPWLAKREQAPPLSQVNPPQVSRWGYGVALRTQLLCSLEERMNKNTVLKHVLGIFILFASL